MPEQEGLSEKEHYDAIDVIIKSIKQQEQSDRENLKDSSQFHLKDLSETEKLDPSVLDTYQHVDEFFRSLGYKSVLEWYFASYDDTLKQFENISEADVKSAQEKVDALTKETRDQIIRFPQGNENILLQALNNKLAIKTYLQMILLKRQQQDKTKDHA